MGQHTKAVLREAGYSASDIEALDVQGTIIQSEEG
jgi:crotonobetainyl-CoA:carnitine CoA-transferase CaiB-like acyl-CoA transferase